MERFAIIEPGSTPLHTIEAYMPENYTAYGTSGNAILIAGEDNAGWTLEGYVIPRLASGLITAQEITAERARDKYGYEPEPDRKAAAITRIADTIAANLQLLLALYDGDEAAVGEVVDEAWKAARV